MAMKVGERWDVRRAGAGGGIKEDDEKLASLLLAGWEPFGVTVGANGYVYHLRIKRYVQHDNNTDED